MKQLVLLGLGIFTLSAYADQPVKNVRINMHNETPYTIQFKNIESLSAFEHISMSMPTIAPYSSQNHFMTYEGFDFQTQRMTFDITLNEQLTSGLWYINMGPVNGASHICGVVPVEGMHLYCSLPTQDPGNPDTLQLDYYFELEP